jgi:hypothetical protein
MIIMIMMRLPCLGAACRLCRNMEVRSGQIQITMCIVQLPAVSHGAKPERYPLPSGFKFIFGQEGDVLAPAACKNNGS